MIQTNWKLYYSNIFLWFDGIPYLFIFSRFKIITRSAKGNKYLYLIFWISIDFLN